MVRLSAAAVLISGCVATDVTPLQKVISMMDDMIKKGKIGRHTSELQSHSDLVCRLLLEKKKKIKKNKQKKITCRAFRTLIYKTNFYS